MDPKWSKRFELIRTFGWLFSAGLLVCIPALMLPEKYELYLLIPGLFLCVPAAIYLYVVTIWHWKDRYKGTHSDLWGVILLVETSGWFKIVYLFRHILPDMQQRGRYRLYKPLPDVF